jgi:peptide/nickel transport system substrate-binding protein
MHTFALRYAIWTTLFALSLSFAGCGGESSTQASLPAESGEERTANSPASGSTDAPDQQTGAPTAAEGGPVEGDWIVIRLRAEPKTLNSNLESAGAYTQRVVYGNGGNIFEPLLMHDMETYELQPHIAKRWEVSEDHLTYTFFLREDVSFSDGVPLTAHDVLFTYESIQNPANDCADKRSYFSDFESATVLDDYTIEFKASKPYFLHLDLFTDGWMGIMPKHIYSVGDYNTHPANRAPVGSGPYVLEQWDTGQRIVLSKRDDYWGDRKPWVNEIHYKIVTDDNAAMQLLRRQEIDEMRLTSEQWVRHAVKPDITDHFQKITLYSPVDGYASSFGWIGWNMDRPQFSDKRVRRAMTMLLDRKTIGETIMHGLVRVVTGTMFPDSPDYDQSIAPWPFDPEGAKKLLDEAGWIDSDQDGIRDKDGMAFRFEWIYASSSPALEQLATVYKEQLDKAGIEVTLRPLEWATFLESVTKRSFDACAMSWVSEIRSDPYQLWHSSQKESGSNYVGFGTAESDKLIEDARPEFDAEKRAEMYRRFHAILHEEQPYTFLYNAKRKVVISNRFQNVKPYSLGFDMREWWVPKELQRYK